MDEIIIELAATGTFAIAVFGAAFSLMHSRASRVSGSFAAFLATVAINNSPDAFRRLIEAAPVSFEAMIDVAVWPSSFFLAPLFWIYVVTLTSSSERGPQRRVRHFILPGVAAVLAVLVLLSPPDIRDILVTDEPKMDTGWSMAVMLGFGLLQLAVYPQIAVYLFLIWRRLMTFRLRLRDVYASTETHELRWIFVICGFCALFWLAQTVLLIVVIDAADSAVPPAYINVASLAGLAVVAALVLWGLRQRPPLVPDDDPETHAPAKNQVAAKYEKSALSAEASHRLGRKLRAAMEVDHLHRDPNLSLWALARHIGASPNYVSQTLNEEIGESFFDFVNGYRVAEAKNLLTTTDQSILAITYDVGFNARSSFYNAFKRITGQTPSYFRKNMSQPAGLDDISI
ncbi:helix-turn-helix domain-containing protein [Tateyamaria armeniaca]|uniref:Helix-turn-helix domain-containing protein n=1 Tax=Tateyamaria armeniaca TaxID=2518930 RepID=A0ABW8V1P3_9RHOB